MAVSSTGSISKRLAPELTRQSRLPSITPARMGAAASVAPDETALARTRQSLETLRETEDLHRLLFEKAARPRFVCDARTLAILAVNDAGIRQYGYSRDELLAMKMTDLSSARHSAPFREYLHRLRPNENRTARVFRHQSKDDGEIAVEVEAAVVPVRGRRLILLMAEDHAGKRWAENQLHVQQATARALAESSTLAEASPKIFKALCDHLGYDWGELWRVDPDADVLRCTQVWDSGQLPLKEMESVTRATQFARGEGLPGIVWQRNKPVWITDLTRHPHFQRAAGVSKYGLRTVFAFPIRLNLEVLGVITMFSRQVQPPDKHLLRLLRNICGQIGQVMGRRRAERRLLEVSEREQQRIGQDLHDGLCQQLTGLAYMASDLQSRLARQGLTDAGTAARIAQLSRETAAQARQVARGLNPVKVGTAGLMAALEELAVSIHSMFAIDCRFECQDQIAVLNHEAAVHIYRIAQEAIHNAITHGEASEIVVSLSRQPEAIVLRVTDNGRGLDHAANGGSGMGMENMHYRARAIGAQLQFAVQPKGGTTMDCVFPLHNRRPQ